VSFTTSVQPSRSMLAPVAWVGRSALATVAYTGAVTLLLMSVPAGAFRRQRRSAKAPHFGRVFVHELFWMLVAGTPLVALVHVAIGSFLSLQSYYGSTFVEGTGAVVGVGLLRNLGGMMAGLTLAGILAARVIPELRVLSRSCRASGSPASPGPSGPTIRSRPDDAFESEAGSPLRSSPHRGSLPRGWPASCSRSGAWRWERLWDGKPRTQ